MLTGLELDQHNRIHVLSLSTWQERRRRLEKLGPR
jgi:hypothetical protein